MFYDIKIAIFSQLNMALEFKNPNGESQCFPLILRSFDDAILLQNITLAFALPLLIKASS